jgi:P27 family predicted phage terminase small subunit
MPAHLTREARKEWRRVLPLLLERGSLTEADSEAVALLCEMKSRWLAAKQDLEQNGLTVNVTVLDRGGNPVCTRKPNPALKIAENCERALRSFLTELGLTPRSRERVVPARKTKESKNSFDAFLEAKQR